LGTGDVWAALGRGCCVNWGIRSRWDRARRAEKAKPGRRDGPAASTGSFAEAAQLRRGWPCSCIVWSGTENALRMAAAKSGGKVLIDATNPLVFTPGRVSCAGAGHTDRAANRCNAGRSGGVVQSVQYGGHAHMFKTSVSGRARICSFAATRRRQNHRNGHPPAISAGISIDDPVGIEGPRMLGTIILIPSIYYRWIYTNRCSY